MGRYRLVAAGEHAKQLKMCDGAPDLLCWTDRPILLGRAVKEGEGYKFPNQWNSLSSRHCSLAFQAGATEGEGEWLVTDTSTNGTFINGAKIGKGSSAVLKPGDMLGLSVVTNAAPPVTNFITVEYVLDYDPGATSPHDAPVASHGSHVVTAQQHKRKAEGSVSPNANAAQAAAAGAAGYKRARSEEGEAPELVQLRKRNEELRGKLDASRQEVEKLEAQLQEVGSQHSKELQEQEEKHHAELAAAERTAAEAVEAERARSSQLQQQLAELAASSAEQHRTLQAQLHEANLQLVARGDEVAVLTTQLQQAQEGLTGRDADISRLQAELLQEQQVVAELQLKAAQHEASAAALQDAQKQLQAKSDALASTQQQLREEQRGRAAAEAAVQRAERALERAKTSLQDKLDSKEENLLVYGRSVQEAHTCLEERLRAQQEELERHQREMAARYSELRGWLDRAAAEHNLHTSTVSGMVQGVKEGLAQISAAGEEAGLEGGHPRCAAGQAGDVDMEAGDEGGQEHAGNSPHPMQDEGSPLTQALGGVPSSTSGNPTPHQSQVGGNQDGNGSTPAATQDAAVGVGQDTGGPAAAAALHSMLPPAANGAETADGAGQTQDLFPATMAFPLFGTAAVTGSTPAFIATCGLRAPAAPVTAVGAAPAAATPATAAPGTSAPPDTAAAELQQTAGRVCVEAQVVGGCVSAATAMQAQFQAQLEEAAGQQQQAEEDEEVGGDGDMADDAEDGQPQDGAALQGSPADAPPAAPQQQQQQQEQQQGEGPGQEVAETPEEATQPDDPGHQRQQQQQTDEDFLAAEQELRGTTPSPLRCCHLQQQQQQEEEDRGDADAAADEEAVAGGPAVVDGTEDSVPHPLGGAVPGGEGEGLTPAGADADAAVASVGASLKAPRQGGQEVEEELGVTTEEEHGSSRKGSLQQQQQQHSQGVLSDSQQQQQASGNNQGEEGTEGQEGGDAGDGDGNGWVMGGAVCHQRPSTYPQQQQKQLPKRLLGSSGSPAGVATVRPHSQPMSAIDLNQQQHVAAHQQHQALDPYEYRD